MGSLRFYIQNKLNELIRRKEVMEKRINVLQIQLEKVIIKERKDDRDYKRRIKNSK